jgi:hypothetical protein
LTVVKVKAGACGFVSRITATKENKREIRITIESDCDSVCDLGFILDENGPLGLKEIMSNKREVNRVFRLAEENIPHSACPVPAAILKVSEVALGLNLPSPVVIEFECSSEDETSS